MYMCFNFEEVSSVKIQIHASPKIDLIRKIFLIFLKTPINALQFLHLQHVYSEHAAAGGGDEGAGVPRPRAHLR